MKTCSTPPAPLVALLALAALGTYAAPVALAADQRPNILLIVVDDLRPALGCCGDPVAKTPAIDRLATRGVLFERAYCNYPICGPSRASFLSGLRPQTSGYYGWAYPKNVTLLPAWLRQHGYFTAEFGKVFHCDRLMFDDEIAAFEKRTGRRYKQPVFRTLNPPGCWDISELCATADDPCGYGYLYCAALRKEDPKAAAHVLARGRLRPEGLKGGWFWSEWAETDLADGETSDGIVVRRAAQTMERAVREGQPFLVAAGIRRPHEARVVPQQYFARFPAAKVSIPPPEPAGHLDKVPALALTFNKKYADRIYSDEDRRQLWRVYHANVSFVDAQIAVLLETLDRLRLWDKTIVVFHTDNGMHLGEHRGLHGKHTLFEESVRSPLIIVAPGFPTAGKRCIRPVELVDIFPTLTELCGLPEPPRHDGTSLGPLLQDPQSSALRAGAISVLLRRVSGKHADSHGGVPLTLESDAGPARQTLGRSLRTGQWRYTEWDNGKLGVELYDETKDPHELNNLAGDRDFVQVQSELKELLTRLDPTPAAP